MAEQQEHSNEVLVSGEFKEEHILRYQQYVLGDWNKDSEAESRSSISSVKSNTPSDAGPVDRKKNETRHAISQGNSKQPTNKETREKDLEEETHTLDDLYYMLRCSICLKLVTAPRLEKHCGALFCSDCIAKRGELIPCVACEETPKYSKGIVKVPDIIVCNNSDLGCTWEGSPQSADKHMLTECEYQRMMCNLEQIGCLYHDIRKNMIKHEEEGKDEHFSLVMSTVLDLIRMDQTLPTGKHKIIKMPDFSKKRESKVEFHSDPFYTPLGYKLELQVSANGRGSGLGTYVSVFINILNSPDAIELMEPLDGEAVIELLNQSSDRHHLKKVVIFDAAKGMKCTGGYGFIRFIHLSDVDRNWGSKRVQYMEHDTLYFRVTLRPNLFRHWLY